MKNIYVLGGGTFNHVRSHLALAAPAFGETARQLHEKLIDEVYAQNLETKIRVVLILTKMADSSSRIVTNDDVATLIDELIEDTNTRAIVFNMALCDFNGRIDDVPSGKYAERLESRGLPPLIQLEPSEKLIGRIRKERKDIFVVGFKTTTNKTADEQYVKGLRLLKDNSVNLVLANDTGTRHNMIIAPEETRYFEGKPRNEVLAGLSMMLVSRIQNTFTRSTVVPGEAVSWDDPNIPEDFKKVINHCISMGAYKPFQGKTAGHFAIKAMNGSMITTIRKTNLNNLDEIGMVQIESVGDDKVTAHGYKPSVGGQSQRIIFREHPDTDCIVHFHCPPKKTDQLGMALQWPNECGSHQCGKNTSSHLKEVDLGDGYKLKAVYLDSHGPNIVFNRNVPAEKVINYIDQNFDLSQKTGGSVDTPITYS